MGPLLSPNLAGTKRVGAVAMNGAIGDGRKVMGFPFSNTCWWAKKSSGLNLPGPSDSWLFTDEQPDRVDDTLLYTDPGATNGTGQFTELPSSEHCGACGLGCADGHAGIHKWKTAATAARVTGRAVQRVGVSQNEDLAWPARRTPRAR
jgi:hypothetical protein